MGNVRRPAWQSSESAQLAAGYQAARQLQALPVPAALAREIANYLCRTDAELAARGIIAERLTAPPESFHGMSDDEVAQRARELQTELVALPRMHPRRDDLIRDWRRCIDELTRRAVCVDSAETAE